jgi:hypothetical protein
MQEAYMTRLEGAVAMAVAVWLVGCSDREMGKQLAPYADAGCTFTPIAIPRSVNVVVGDNTAWGVPEVSKLPGSKVWRVDLQSGTVQYSKDLGEGVQQIGLAAGALWACTRSWWALGPGMTIRVLDPATLEQRDSIRVKGRMLITRRAVFDCSDNPPALIPIDTSTLRPLSPIPLDAEFGELGPICDGPQSEVYVLGTFSGMLARVNVRTYRVEAQAHVGTRAVHPVSLEGILGGTGQGAYFGLIFNESTVQVISTRRGEEEIIVCDAATCQPISRRNHFSEAWLGMFPLDGRLWETCHVRETALSWAATKTMIVGHDPLGARADTVIDPRLNGRLIQGDGRLWFFAGDQLCRMEFDRKDAAGVAPPSSTASRATTFLP